MENPLPKQENDRGFIKVFMDNRRKGFAREHKEILVIVEQNA